MSKEYYKTCAERISGVMANRVKDLREIMNAMSNNKRHEELGTLGEYGLCFDFVPLGTFADQSESYFRYQISWGGPSDELRFFVNDGLHCHRVEYWFMDWFDGAHRICKDETFKLMIELWTYWHGQGLVRRALRAALT